MKYLKTFELFESKQQNYYHGTYNNFKNNFILTPQKGYTWQEQEQEIENLLEKHRPKWKISRKDCVFLVDDPSLIDPTAEFTTEKNYSIYEVQPIGQIDKSDLYWYEEIKSRDLIEENVLPFIMNYWNGILWNNSNESLPEYRCQKAIVINKI